MDTTLMPWFAGLIILFVLAMVFLITRAYTKRNRRNDTPEE